MGRLSQTEAIARGLLRYYLPDVEMIFNIRPTFKDGAKPWQKSQARLYGVDLDGLELDIYIPVWQVAIEVNGAQHYRQIDHFTKGDTDVYLRQIERDSRKVDLCRQQGITLYHCSIFDLLPSKFEPFIKQLMKDHGRLEHFHRTTPPRVLYAQADKLSRARVKSKLESRPYRKPGLLPLLQRAWVRYKHWKRGMSKEVYG